LKFNRKLYVAGIVASLILLLTPTMAMAKSAADCQKSSFFGLSAWYKYLQFDSNCDIVFSEQVTKFDDSGKKTTINSNFNFKEVWLIAFAVIEMLLQLAGVVAVVFVIIGGFKYVIARGNADKLVLARKTILNALIGVVIAILSSQVVSFIASRLVS